MSTNKSTGPLSPSQAARIKELERTELIGLGKVLREAVAALTDIELAINERLAESAAHQPMDGLISEMREVRSRMLQKFMR